MISFRLQVVLILAVILYFFLLFVLLKKNRLILKYSLLWVFSGVLMLVLALFPGLLTELARLVGVYDPVNALFAVITFCSILVMVSLTSIVSNQNEKIKRLVQQIAILEKEEHDEAREGKEQQTHV